MLLLLCFGMFLASCSLQGFYHKEFLDNFVKGYSATAEMNMIFFSFSLLIRWITLICFHMLNYSWISGIKSTWSWWIIFWMSSQIQFVSILLNIFASIFMKGTVLNFSFFVEFCVLFVSGWLWSHKNHFATFFLFIIWSDLKNIGNNSSLKVWFSTETIWF